MAGLVILQCDNCPALFTTDKNPEVGVHWSKTKELIEAALQAGWTEHPPAIAVPHYIERQMIHLCPKCSAQGKTVSKENDNG